jgi:hypothetical protein
MAKDIPGVLRLHDAIGEAAPAVFDSPHSGLGICLTSAPLGYTGGGCVREDFWLIVVTEGNEDGPEIGEETDGWSAGDQGHSPSKAQAVFIRRKDSYWFWDLVHSLSSGGFYSPSDSPYSTFSVRLP